MIFFWIKDFNFNSIDLNVSKYRINQSILILYVFEISTQSKLYPTYEYRGPG